MHLDPLKQANLKNTWLTIGSFDGVHQGHQYIIRKMVSSAHSTGAIAVVLTFHPHPAIVLGRRENPYSLTTPEERAGLLEQLGVDAVITQPFDQSVAMTSARDYMAHLVASLDVRMLWVGHDFALGHNREGNVAALHKIGAEQGFRVHEFDPISIDGEVVSSSQVRKLLHEGDLKRAANLLDRLYSVEGTVVPGDQRGRTIGIPTANLLIAAEKIIPANGVYACRGVVDGQVWPAATNIGVRPTFDGQSSTRHVEAHLIGFEGEIYKHNLRLDFIERLRGEQKFASIQDLMNQIHLDISQTRRLVQLANFTK